MVCNSAAYAQTTLNISPGVRHFYYKETTAKGLFLDKETGRIAGIQGHLTQQANQNSIYSSLNIGLFDGRIEYDGHTQAGKTLVTRTNETFYNAGLSLGKRLGTTETPLTIYTTLEYHWWDRDILPTNTTQGLFERYKWWELSFGVTIDVTANPSHDLTLDLSLSHTLQPKMMVDLSSQGFGKPVLDLDSKLGAAIKLSYTLYSADNYQFGVAGKYKTWKFGASKPKAINNGVRRITITEPDSATHTVEMQFVVEHYFF